MTRLGLTVNEAKTSLKDARQERFDFLGFPRSPQRPHEPTSPARLRSNSTERRS